MKPIKVNWEIPLLTSKAIEQMWSELNFAILDGEDFEFVKLLRSNLGGRLYFKGFRFDENEIFDWFCSRGRLDSIEFESKFLLSEEVLRTFNNLYSTENWRLFFFMEAHMDRVTKTNRNL